MAHTVMVTGADGFIGSHLTEELVKKGEKVKAFCYYNSFGKWGWLDTLPKDIKSEIEVFMGDIRDNMDNYINFRLAQWYGRDSVIGYTPSSSE